VDEATVLGLSVSRRVVELRSRYEELADSVAAVEVTFVLREEARHC
jgi:hypothetical protein